MKGEAQGIVKGEAQGIVKGEAQGIVKGEAQGIVKGKQDAVLKILQIRFHHVPDTLSQKIAEIQSIPKLDTLLDQAMISESLKDIDVCLNCDFYDYPDKRSI